MQPAEQLRVVLFVSAVALVYVLAAAILVRLALHSRGYLVLSSSRRAVWLRRVILSLAGVGLLCMAYGFAIEPTWLEVTHVHIQSAKLPPQSRPIRIVHVSDLHSEPAARLEARLPDVIASARPDLVVFTGDALNTPQGLPVFRKCLTRIAAIAPTLAVRGNWDAWYWSNLNLFGETGATELVGQAVRAEVRGTPVWLTGVPVEGEDRITAALDRIPADELSIFLHHYPDQIMQVAGRGVDLYCAGHTHGGQIALPFYGALVTFSKFGKRFESWLHRVGRTWLYVNRGIGMEGGHAPRVRFCARPEVTVIDISPADETRARSAP